MLLYLLLMAGAAHATDRTHRRIAHISLPLSLLFRYCCINDELAITATISMTGRSFGRVSFELQGGTALLRTRCNASKGRVDSRHNADRRCIKSIDSTLGWVQIGM
ncbi:hypothetical protein FRB91_004279 [Serendipita sp. 411]|nr:hypothetical protein FRC19_001650 [Serendipita sp. 401]KAG8831670.1 hypothetical protein FRC18_006195 [Serendipita sp. 400]KAG8853848.1 hypothetical protein FRB91_004279 [Serendipita sp. 411]KAG9054991.1 hypothetical protein FS842_003442 [Serendipita sp. 407]